jgi:hypothetical protein
MKSVKRFTSDNLTGFNRNSSAPSSKQLPIIKNRKSIKMNKQGNKQQTSIHGSSNLQGKLKDYARF